MRIEFVVSDDSVLMVENVGEVEYDGVRLIARSVVYDDPWGDRV